MDWQTLLIIAEGLVIPGVIAMGVFIARQAGRIARTETRLEQAEAAIAETKSDFRQHSSESVQLLQRVASMETDMKAIKDTLSRLEGKIDSINGK